MILGAPMSKEKRNGHLMLAQKESEPRRTRAHVALRVMPPLLVGALVIGAMVFLPLSSDSEPIIRGDLAKDTITLKAGMTAVQTFPAPRERIAGVVLFADADRLQGRQIRVRVLGPDGRAHAQGSTVRPAYEHGLLRLTFPLRWFAVPQEEELTTEVTLVRGPSLSLRAGRQDVFPRGLLRIRGQDGVFGDLALSVLHPAPVSFGTRQGAIAGVALLVGLALLPLLPRERYRWWGVVALLVFITPVALSGFWFSKGSWGISDWDYYFSLHETYRRSLLTHHAFPFWNAATCGGTAGLGDPEFPGFTVTFLLELLFGVPTGLRMAIVTSVIIGSVGMVLLGRRLRLSPEAALVGALGAFFGTVNLLEVVEGHVNIFAAMWIPWIFWSWLGAYRGIRNKEFGMRGALLPGVFLALTFFQGGIYLLFYTLLAFLVLPFLVARPLAAVRTTLASGLWALGLASVKLVPVLFWLREFPDETYASSTVTLPWLTEILLGRHLHGVEVIPNQGGGWHEYGAYLGPFLLALAFLGIAGRRRRLVAGLVVSVSLALLLSSAGPLLKPSFDVLPFLPRSNISRVIFFAVIPLSLLAGMGLDVLRTRLRRFAFVSSLLVGVVAIDLMSLAYPLSEQAFIIPEVVPPVAPAPSPIAFTLYTYATKAAGEQHTRAYAATLAGYGALSYCSVLGPKPLVRTIHDEGDISVVSLERSGGRAELLSWSPNRVRVRATVPTETNVVLNTNYARGWMANGRAAENVGGRVGTPVSAGSHDVTFVYRPEGFIVGLLVTVGTVLGALVGAFAPLKRSASGRWFADGRCA